jgi:cytochrome P450
MRSTTHFQPLLTAQDGYTVITTYREAEEILRRPQEFRAKDGRGDEALEFIGGTVTDLDGEAHAAQRRILAKVMSQGHVEHYVEVLTSAAHRYLAMYTRLPYADGVGPVRFNLVDFARNVFWHLGACMTGLDGVTDTERIDRLAAVALPAIEGTTMLFSLKDHDLVARNARIAVQRFDIEFYSASSARRRDLLQRVARGELPESELPVDVLTQMLKAYPEKEHDDLIIRQCIAFLSASVGSTVNVICHALAELTSWLQRNGEDKPRLLDDEFLSSVVDETIRMHRTGNPYLVRTTVVDTKLGATGRSIPAGTRIALDLRRVSRDPAMFGPDADTFNPRRRVSAARLKGYGLGFGTGPHVCLAKRMVVRDSADSASPRIVDIVLKILIAAAVQPDPSAKPIREPHGGDRFQSFPVMINSQ